MGERLAVDSSARRHSGEGRRSTVSPPPPRWRGGVTGGGRRATRGEEAAAEEGEERGAPRRTHSRSPRFARVGTVASLLCERVAAASFSK